MNILQYNNYSENSHDIYWRWLLISSALTNARKRISSKTNILLKNLYGSKLCSNILTGNGYIAASFDSKNGVYIRLNRALSVQVPFYPVVGTMIEGQMKEG